MIVNVSENIAVSLGAVSTVNVVKDKQVLNMCYSKTHRGKLMSDFVYIPKNNTSFYDSKYFKENFVRIEGVDRIVYVNVNHVSQLVKDYKGKTPKILINFKNSVELHNPATDEKSIVPEYMYITFGCKDDLDFSYDLISSVIESKPYQGDL